VTAKGSAVTSIGPGHRSRRGSDPPGDELLGELLQGPNCTGNAARADGLEQRPAASRPSPRQSGPTVERQRVIFLNGEVLDPSGIQDVVTSIVGAPRRALHGCVDVQEPPREAALFALDDRRGLRTSSEGQSMPTWRADSNVRFSRWRCPGPCGSAAAMPGALAQGRSATGTRLRWKRARLHVRLVAGRWDC
jgi:hypothetical protein